MKTKLFRVLVILLYLNFFILNSLIYVKAAESIQAVNININATNSGDILLNPGVDFYFEFNGNNNGDSDVSQVKSYVWFENLSSNNISSYFTYIPGSLRTRINSVNINDPIPNDSFSLNGFVIDITNSSNPLVPSTANMSVSRKLQYGMSVPYNFPNYSNLMKGYFQGKGIDDSDLYSQTLTRNIYVNVKPHITDYYFAQDSVPVTSMKSDGIESVDLYVKVKDFNGCSNIDGGLVSADLNLLGYSTSQDLLYDSCEGDGLTAVFRKTGVTTTASLGEKQFLPTHFNATDEDGNSSDYLDSRFNSDDRQTALVFNISSPGAPQVTLINVSDYYIGGPGDITSIIDFSGSQSGFSKVVLDSDETCSIGTVLSDWTVYTGGDTINYELTSDQLLTGSNAIYLCIKNESEELGSYIVNITKDITQPVISDFIISPSSVVTGDANLTFKCSEDGFYSSCYISGENCLSIIDWTQTASLNSNINSISNSMLSIGTNTIIGKCKDNASNVTSNTGTINKIQPTPSMEGRIISFQDLDFDYPGFDGRDIFLSWDNTPGIGFSGFQSRRIFILPEFTQLNTSLHNYIGIESDVNKTSWVGTSSIKNDSAGNLLQQGITYTVYVAIISSSGLYGDFGTLTYSDFIYDIVNNAKVLFASFVSKTLIELTTDSILDPDLLSHSGSLLSFNIGGSLFNGQGIFSVDGTKIRISIPQLENTYSTGNNLVLLTGALHSSGGGYNDYFSSGSLIVQDKIAPIISGFSNSTIPGYGSFYSGDLSLSRYFSEQMSGFNKTYIELSRSGGNADSTLRRQFLNDAIDLTIGNHSKQIQLSGLNLTCGTIYNGKIFGTDMNGNTSNSNNITNIGYDNCPPSSPVLNQVSTLGTGNTTLNWSASIDDFGNGSGIKYYQFSLYNGTGCNSINTTINNGNVASKAISVPDGSYSWNVYSVDNMNNKSQNSVCDDFNVDSTIPAISNSSITDTILNSSQFTKSGNQLQIKSTIINSDIDNIVFDLTTIAGSSAYSGFVCSQGFSDPNIDCIYDGQVTLTFDAGFAGSIADGNRQITIKAYNTHGINLQTANVSISVDNTLPVINSGFFTAPLSDSYVGKNYNITRTPSKIIDSNLSRIKLDYSSGTFSTWINLFSGSNSGLYNWNLISLQSGNYKLRATAFDVVGNSTEYEMPYSFFVDTINPLINSDLLILPTNGQYIKGNNDFNIQWNSGSITDTNINNNRLDIYYSLNNGVDYTAVVTGTQNDGLYTWSIPHLNTQSLKLKFIAYDLAGNSFQYVPSSSFILDSTSPNLVINYANSGGSTPPDSSFINSSGFDISGNSTDTNLDKAYYMFVDSTNSLYRNNGSSSWLGVENWNEICTTNCANFFFSVSPLVNDGNTYTLQIKSIDLAGNATVSSLINYTGDNTDPVVIINNLSGTYFKDSIIFSGTANDGLAGLSSVNIDIKKGNEYWDGSNWTNDLQGLGISGTNESWTYEFVSHPGDLDGQVYQLQVNAYDNSFKVNNSYNTGITFIADKTPPVISSTNFWTFPTGGIIKGGMNVDIVWNSNNITDNGIGIDYVNIDYFDGNEYQSITVGESNDGIYNWAVPQFTDISNSRLRLTVYDKLGNNSTILSNTFSIDSLPPSIQTLTSLDMDANGQIDAIRITMSESILDSTIELGDFLISDGIGNPTSWESGLSPNDNKFIIKFANIGNTSTTPNVNYTKGSLTDIAGNPLESSSNGAIDGASPRVQSIQALDLDQNGKLDQIKLSFSETLNQESILTGFSIGNSLDGMLLSDITINENFIFIDLVESIEYNTNTQGLTLSLNNTIYKDLNNNLVGNFTDYPIGDLANPVLISAQIFDTDSNYKADKIQLTFSESVTGAVSTGDFVFSNLSSGSYISSSSILDNKINFIVQETLLDNDTDNVPLFYYTGIQISDLNGNGLLEIASTTVQDKIPPKLLTRTAQDSNGNGKVDLIRLEFSEDLNDDFSGINSVVNGYVVSGYSTDIPNDNIIYVQVDEVAYFDGASQIKVIINSNSTLQDVNGNAFIQEVVDSFATDGVGPVIAGSRFEPGANLLYLTFSESIDDSSLFITGFVFDNGGTSQIQSIDTGISPNDNLIELTIIDEQIVYGTTQISYVPGSIKDLLGNSQDIESYSDISASVIINEVMWSDIDLGANQYIELRNLSDVDVDLTGWIIENAGGNLVDFTLPSLNLSGNGYLLIAKSEISSSLLNITPDYVYPQMNLSSSMNDLVLKNGIVTNDVARIAFVPVIGDNDLPRAMERNSNPGSGIISSSWYSSHASLGFDNDTIKGTPGVANVFDSVSPTFESSFPSQNQLLFQDMFNITLQYSDNLSGVGVNTSDYSAQLMKWDGTSYYDITLTG
ncbi:MAG: lamin tail domain-containing protein, partial [Candidatus Absconditabacteria bacterium]